MGLRAIDSSFLRDTAPLERSNQVVSQGLNALYGGIEKRRVEGREDEKIKAEKEFKLLQEEVNKKGTIYKELITDKTPLSKKLEITKAIYGKEFDSLTKIYNDAGANLSEEKIQKNN